MRVLCWFGWHNWSRTDQVNRYCMDCFLHQVLMLNNPTYKEGWHDHCHYR